MSKSRKWITLDGAAILRRAVVYLSMAYPRIKNDIYRCSPDRTAAEILMHLSHLVELTEPR